jgi:membrane associated rhomboid family serine protease
MFAILNGVLFPANGVDAWGHLGGFIVGGFLSVFVLKTSNEGEKRRYRFYFNNHLF